MKRFWIAAFVFAVLMLPVAATAQTSGALDTEIPVTEIGDEWTAEYKESTGTTQNPWRKRLAFFGPDGNRVLVLAFGIGDSIDERAFKWDEILAAYDLSRGGTLMGMSDKALPAPLADETSDAIRRENLDIFGRFVGVGAYAFSDHPIAIVVIVQGKVNELEGVTATDYIAGLYFAALSE